MLKGSAIIGQSGGPTSVINASLCGIIQQCLAQKTIGKTLGMRFGIEGFLQENIIEKVLVNKVEPLKVELKTFLDCARSGKSFPVTPEEALNNLEICEKIKLGLRGASGV